jgi:predicted adenine nucleotide alpha hydrolase (AANH) superfamily ATPase
MKSSYQKQLDELITSLSDKKPSLLLHACCAPCSSYVLEYLSEHFQITILYYNPNIYPQTEYERRLQELIDFLPKFEPAIKNKIQLIQTEYNPEEFFNAIDIKTNPELASEPERGERCRRCYKFRMQKAYDYAKQNNFDYFCTTLSISPFKDAEKINILGNELQNLSESGPKWLTSDFKKKNGFKRSLEISSEFDLYRQDYCGCSFSKKKSES